MPVELWKYGGPCFNSWCHTGWYSSPAVTTIAGKTVVVGGFYAFSAVNGADGTNVWSNDFSNAKARMWPGIVVADVDNDGVDELVTASGSGWVGIWNKDTGAAYSSNWPKQIGTNEWRSLAVADLDGDKRMEIVIGKATGATLNTWVLEIDGSVRTGWPQPTSNTQGYSWGVYNDNIAITNMDSDSQLEVIVPSDVTYTCAYKADGTSLGIGPVGGPAAQNKWGLVQFTTDHQYEVLGYADCSGYPTVDPSRTNFADGPVTVVDVDGDGVDELVFVGRTYQFCNRPDEVTIHNGVYILRKDRTRWAAGGYDWTVVPDNKNHPSLGAPLSMDYNVIQPQQYNPVVVDIDGDGKKEIIFSGFDGKIHVFWLDKTEKYSWPYIVGTPSKIMLSSEPAVVDIDNDGFAEIIVNRGVPRLPEIGVTC